MPQCKKDLSASETHSLSPATPCVFVFRYAASCVRTHLQRLVPQVHLEQRVSHQVSETTAVEVAVGPSVAPAVVDLRELQAAVLLQVVSVQVLVLAEHLSEAGTRGNKLPSTLWLLQ